MSKRILMDEMNRYQPDGRSHGVSLDKSRGWNLLNTIHIEMASLSGLTRKMMDSEFGFRSCFENLDWEFRLRIRVENWTSWSDSGHRWTAIFTVCVPRWNCSAPFWPNALPQTSQVNFFFWRAERLMSNSFRMSKWIQLSNRIERVAIELRWLQSKGSKECITNTNRMDIEVVTFVVAFKPELPLANFATKWLFALGGRGGFKWIRLARRWIGILWCNRLSDQKSDHLRKSNQLTVWTLMWPSKLSLWQNVLPQWHLNRPAFWRKDPVKLALKRASERSPRSTWIKWSDPSPATQTWWITSTWWFL